MEVLHPWEGREIEERHVVLNSGSVSILAVRVSPEVCVMRYDSFDRIADPRDHPSSHERILAGKKVSMYAVERVLSQIVAQTILLTA